MIYQLSQKIYGTFNIIAVKLIVPCVHSVCSLTKKWKIFQTNLGVTFVLKYFGLWIII